MISAKQLAKGYALNLRLIMLQTDGLSHADSLTQSPYNINCMNWVLGHLAVGRDEVLTLLGEKSLLSEAEKERYRTGSQAVKGDGPNVIRLERLLTLLAAGQEGIERGLERMSEANLAKTIQVDEHTLALGERLYGLYFHDTYHTGQTDLLRQISGKNDKIV